MSRPHWDADMLNDLAEVMREASICGLGQAAPNPLVSSLVSPAGVFVGSICLEPC